MSLSNKYITKFRNDMKTVIHQWDSWEKSYYTEEIIPACDADPVIGKFLSPGGKIMFPTNVYSVWTQHGKIDGGNILTYDDLITAYENEHLYTVKIGNTVLEKGQTWEWTFQNALLKSQQTNGILERLKQVFSKKLQWVGPEFKREDFLMSKDYSIDVKYSNLEDYNRFRNIIKPFNAQEITSTTEIIDGILRSVYKEGAKHGNFRPSTEITSGNYGMYLLPTGKHDFQEVTKDIYNGVDKKGNPLPSAGHALPSLRKNLIFLFNDGGYWASEMLQKITTWAAARLAHYPNWGGTGQEFDNTKGAQSVDPYQFWKFTKNTWTTRQTWYARTK